MQRTGILNNLNDQSALEVSDEERQRIFEERWAEGGTSFMAAFNDLIFDQRANDAAAEFVRDRIREIVQDPATAELLAPKDYPIGTKRICVDTHYFETYNRPNVTLVDVRSTPISEITPKGVRVGDTEYELDAIVFATGFDAMTGALLNIDIQGRTAPTLRDKWEAGPRTYLGLMAAGFPNLFMITGPGSPSVLSNMMVSIEQHVDWIVDCLAHLRAQRPGDDRADAGSRGRLGRARQRGGAHARCTRRRPPGTWAPTSPASRACSCRISAASARTGRSATTSRQRATPGSACPPGPRCRKLPSRDRLPPQDTIGKRAPSPTMTVHGQP